MGVVDRPMVVLDFDGPSGNSVALVSKCMRVARNAGWIRGAIDAFRTEALSHNREHVLDTIFEYFEVYQEETVHNEVNREGVV